MNHYCKKCGCFQPHIKAGRAAGKQLYQCSVCGKRHVEPSKKKKCLTTTVAVRLTEEDLARLDILPGNTRSARIRAAISMAAKHKP